MKRVTSLLLAVLALCLVTAGPLLRGEEAAKPTPTATGAPSEEEGDRAIIARLPKDLKDATFRQLWDVARLWEVGENQQIVRKVREELARRGKSVLQDVIGEFPAGNSGLEMRAFEEYFRSLGDDAVEPILGLMRSENETTRSDALYLVRSLSLRKALPGLRELLKDEELAKLDPTLMSGIPRVMALLGDTEAIPALLRQFESPKGELDRLSIMRALQSLKSVELAPFFIALCGDELISIRYLAMRSLVAIGEACVGTIEASLGNATLAQKRTLIEALGHIAAYKPPPPADDIPVKPLSESSAVRVLMAFVGDPEWTVRFSTYRALGFVKESGMLSEDRFAELRAALPGERDRVCRRELIKLLTVELK